MRRLIVSSKFTVLKKVLKGTSGKGFSLGGSLESEVLNGPPFGTCYLQLN